jgi:phosphoribosylamine--glycine ligase
MVDKTLGRAGEKIILEEYIDGPEFSYLIFTDGISYSVMPVSQDYKKLNNDDQGPNTGSMGAYAPSFLVTQELSSKIEMDIIYKVINGIRTEKFNYKGVLYICIILNNYFSYVLEFNCRFGDPEAQVILPLLDTDLTDICDAILKRKISDIKINWKKNFQYV